LTVIVPRRAGVAAECAGGQSSIGLRCPAHEGALALLRAARAQGVQGVAAPSANRFGRVSPTTAAHVRQEFGDAVAVLDGGACEVGIESTIVDATRGVPIVLRPGAISLDQIAQATGQRAYTQAQWQEANASSAPKASGTLEQHYAPRAKVRLMSAQELQSALDLLAQTTPPEGPPRIALYARTALKVRTKAVRERRMPDDAAETAKQLYAVLRSFDDLSVSLIWIEAPPDDAAWDGVRDRLSRASA
jgi:L-threonylcarbamoyladenylate synthase